MTEAEEVIDKDLMTGIEESILLLYPNPENIILQEVPVTGNKITIIKVTADSPQVTDNPDSLSGGPELHLGHPAGTMASALPAGNLVILPDNVLKRTLL